MGSFAAIAGKANYIAGRARSLPAVSDSGAWVLVMDSADNSVKLSSNAGAYGALVTSLDTAYDGGRTITADAGAIAINYSGAANSGIVVTGAAASNNAQYAATFDHRGTAGTAAGNGVVNIEVGAATTLTGQLVGLEIDLSANVTPGANALLGLRILTGATTRASTAGEAAIAVNSDATRMRVVDLDVANTGGTLVSVRYGAATTLSATLTGLTLDLTTNVTGGSQLLQGLQVIVPDAVTTSSYAANFDYRNTNGTTTSVGVVTINVGAASTIGNAMIGLLVDLNTNVTTNSTSAMTGVNIQIPNYSTSSAVGQGAIVINSRAAGGRLIDLQYGNIGGVLIPIIAAPVAGSSTLTGQLTGISLDMNTSIIGNTNQIRGLIVLVGGGSATPALSSSYCATFDFRTATGTAAGNGIVNIEVGGGLEPTGQLVGLEIDLTTNITTPGAVAYIGVRISTAATSRASTAGEGALAINSDATAARVLDLDVANTSGTLAQLRWGSSASFAGTVTGWLVDMTTNTTPGAQVCTGVDIRIPATTAASAAAQAAIAVNSDATAARVLDVDVANTSGTLAQLRWGAAASFAGTITCLLLDATTNTTPGAQVCTGVDIRIPATSAANAAGQAALAINSDATAARVLDIDAANTSSVIAQLRYGSAATITGTVTGWLIDLTTNTTPSSTAMVGLDIRIPATSASSTAAQAAITINSDATAARVLDIDVANVSGTLAQLRWGPATSLTGTTTGWLVDLTTNTTPGAQACIGVDIRIPATSASGAAAQAALAINSDATAARVLDIDYANTSGTIIAVRSGATPSFAGAITGLSIDLTTNITPGSQNVTGITVSLPMTGTGTLNALSFPGGNGAGWTFGQWQELLTLSTVGATTNTTAAIPANSLILAVDAIVTTTITTATDWSVGDSTTNNRFAAANATMTAGAASMGLRHLQGSVSTDATGPIVTGSTTVRITTTGTPGAGVVRITARYITFVGATA